MRGPVSFSTNMFESKSSLLLLSLACTLSFFGMVSSIWCEANTTTSCITLSETEKSPYTISRTEKIRLKGRRCIVSHLHEPKYGYLGDACVSGYNLTGSDCPVSRDDTWRVVCKAQSHIFAVLMALQTTDGDYLQIRRRKIEGSRQSFEGFDLKLSSILVGLFRNEIRTSKERSSFRMIYICVENASKTNIANSILTNRKVLDYLAESDKQVMEKVMDYLGGNDALIFDPVIGQVIGLSSS